jgi:hypothetical protein
VEIALPLFFGLLQSVTQANIVGLFIPLAIPNNKCRAKYRALVQTLSISHQNQVRIVRVIKTEITWLFFGQNDPKIYRQSHVLDIEERVVIIKIRFLCLGILSFSAKSKPTVKTLYRNEKIIKIIMVKPVTKLFAQPRSCFFRINKAGLNGIVYFYGFL